MCTVYRKIERLSKLKWSQLSLQTHENVIRSKRALPLDSLLFQQQMIDGV